VAGRSRRHRGVADAVEDGRGRHLRQLHSAAAVDQALGTAALAGRFGDNDLASILAHQQAGPTGPATRASETHSLQPGTISWAGFGTPASIDSVGGEA
jgi:hypothetical protein